MYFDQRLGAVHSKHWLKNAFSHFSHKKIKKEEKSKKIEAALVALWDYEQQIQVNVLND